MSKKKKKKSENYLISYDFAGLGLSTNEKRWGGKRFSEYRKAYPQIRKLSDLQLLEEVVFLEALQERYKKKIQELGKISNEDVDKDEVVPKHIQMEMRDNLKEITDLKTMLGMFQEKDKFDAFKDLDELFKKFAVWRNENQGSRKVTCPFCSKPFFLMIRTDKYDAKKFPFFKDKILCHPILHKLWKDERITSEEYAKVLGVSKDFPEWLDEHWWQKDPSVKASDSIQEE